VPDPGDKLAEEVRPLAHAVEISQNDTHALWMANTTVNSSVDAPRDASGFLKKIGT
jgi:hypothetical protein